jgi:hypothetical protein
LGEHGSKLDYLYICLEIMSFSLEVDERSR